MTITLLRKSANRRIINERDVINILRKFANTVNTVEFTANTPVKDQLATMSSTTILVSTHTSGLANAIFLPPGAVVIELIQRNWVWANLDQVFWDHTRSLGDVHHYAWRAMKKEEVVYMRKDDEKRFGGDEWAGIKCDIDECSEAHTRVDLVVDTVALEGLLTNRLPLVMAGATVEEAALPWPDGGGYT